MGHSLSPLRECHPFLSSPWPFDLAVTSRYKGLEEFEELTFDMIDASFRLLHAIAKKILWKKLPKARDVYTTYENLFKGPHYDYVLSRIRKGDMKTYQEETRRSMNKLVEYLKNY